ncbi:MAG: hypothetical protein Kow00124_24620 [Anaerolineae bacterium]
MQQVGTGPEQPETFWPLPFKVSPAMATLISVLVVGALMALLMAASVGARTTPLGTILLLGVVGIVVAVIVLFKPIIGSYILVVSIFSNLSSIIGISGLPSINQIVVLLVALGVLFNRVLIRRQGFEIKRTELLLLLFGIIAALTALVARDRVVVLTWAFDFAKDFIILLGILYSMDNIQDWRRAAWFLLGTAALLALLGVYQVVTGNYGQTFMGFANTHYQNVTAVDYETRLTGPLDDPNYYGQIMVAVLPLAIYRVLDARKLWVRLLAAAIAFLIGFAIIYSYSRGAFLATAFVLFLMLLERRIKAVHLVPLALLGLVIFLSLPTTYKGRLLSLANLTTEGETGVYSDRSLRGRTSELRTALLMWSEHPFLGVGMHNYVINYQDYARRIGLEYRAEPRQAHSLYFEVLAEMGIIGFTVFSAFLVTLFRELGRVRRSIRLRPDLASWRLWIAGVEIGLAGYLFSSLFLHNDYFRYFMLLVTFAVAAIHLTDNLVKAGAAAPEGAAPPVPVEAGGA